VIANKSTTASVSNIALDLAPSAGRLIFDTKSGGSGVEVFQFHQADQSSAMLLKVPNVQDGDDALDLQFMSFKPGQDYTFSMMWMIALRTQISVKSTFRAERWQAQPWQSRCRTIPL